MRDLLGTPRRLGLGLAAAALLAAAMVTVVPPPSPAQASVEPVPPGCAQPSHPNDVDLQGCLYSSGQGSITGSAWTATDPPEPQGIVVNATTAWCTSGSGTRDVCTTGASIRWIDVLQGDDPSNRPVFYQPALPNVSDPWEKLAVCGITRESLPVEHNTMARCYMVGQGNVAQTEVIPVVITAEVTIQGVPEGSGDGIESNCRTSLGDRFCNLTQLVSTVGTVTPTETDFDPSAAFEHTVGEDGLVTFTNLSTDPEDSPAQLSYLWTFEEGETSTEEDPVHRFEEPGTHPVSLVVTDTAGNTASVTNDVVIGSPGLVVNSTGDGGAIDVASRGCDTGGTIGDDPECTLRAAIEAANERGGGEISFAIDAADVPSITIESLLPALSSSTVVDGTTQEPAGFVEVDGGTGFAAGLRLEGGTSRVTGLVLKELLVGVGASGGTDHVIEGNRFAVDSAGTSVNGVLANGVVSTAPNTQVRDNVMRCVACVVLDSGADGSVVADNGFGVGPGDTIVGTVGTGVAALDAQVTVEDNLLRMAELGILVQGPGAEGSVVARNRMGVGEEGGGFTVDGEGIRIDAAPGVEVLDNVITSRSIAGVLVTGSIQTEQDGEELVLRPPSLDPVSATVTGGGTVIRGNTIGLLADGATPSGNVAPLGIVAWAGADGLTIETNTIANQSTGIQLLGGAGHRVVGNRLGVDATGATPITQANGVQAYDTTDLAVGSLEAGNVVRATGTSVTLSGSAVDATVVGNDLAGADAGILSVLGPDEPEAVTVTGLDVSDNTVDAAQNAISLATPAVDAVVANNTLQGGDTAGVSVGDTATGTQVEDNTILGANLGILDEGVDTTISDNHVGVDDGGDVDGGDLAGISLLQDGEATGNVVAGYADAGILVDPAAVGTLRGNAVYDIDDLPIAAPSGPASPTLTGAVQTSTGGETDRLVVLVDGLPADDTGTVEVFASTDCTDPEARHVLDVTVAKPPGRTYAVVPLIGRGDRDSFTATYTTATEGTSELSSCVERDTSPPDGDGDGTPDPIEDLIGSTDDDTIAAVVTDDADLLRIETSDGTLAAVRAVDDPASATHPAGFALPNGTLGFQVDGVGEGGAAEVTVANLDSPIEGDTYWKHGLQDPEGTARWYRFTPDAATGTGAELGTLVAGDLIVRAWFLDLVDGERGDADLFLDGTIRDPGGPGIVEQAFTDVPPTHPFFDDVGWMAAEGVSTGYPGGTYRPSAAVTRQAMSAFMYRLADSPPFTPSGGSFGDVGSSHPFYDEIEWMADTGISEGYPGGTYRPSAPVTRQAMSAFMYRLAGEPDFTASGWTFTDVPTVHPFYDEIEWMADSGISEGYPGGTYRPSAPVTRQAMSAFMFRLAAGPGVDT